MMLVALDSQILPLFNITGFLINEPEFIFVIKENIIVQEAVKIFGTYFRSQQTPIELFGILF